MLRIYENEIKHRRRNSLERLTQRFRGHTALLPRGNIDDELDARQVVVPSHKRVRQRLAPASSGVSFGRWDISW